MCVFRKVENDPDGITDIADDFKFTAGFRHSQIRSRKQSRQAEYDRLTALPGVCAGRWAMSGAALIAHPDEAATKLAC
jgi:hypothetical protein